MATNSYENMRHIILFICILFLTDGLVSSKINPPAKSARQNRQSMTGNFPDQKMLLRNLTFNRGHAFVVMPGIDADNPNGLDDTDPSWHFNFRLSEGLNECITVMRMQDLESGAYGFPMFSNRDMSIPFILVPAQATGVEIKTFYRDKNEGPRPMVLLNLQTRNRKGEWKDAGHSKRNFYSYKREGEDFTIRFNENRTGKFRAVKMTIASKYIPVESNNWQLPTSARDTRTWIFIQLPETDDPDYLLDHLGEAAPDIFPETRKYMTPPTLTDSEGYPYDWVGDPDLIILNLQLNNEFAFLTLPATYGSTIRKHLAPLERPDRPSLTTGMFIGSLYNILYCSSQDVEHPIILVPPYKTDMTVGVYVDTDGNIVPMELAALKVPDGNGRWRDATEEERQFYAYRRDGEKFAMTFPENKSPDFRCIAMTIRTADGYNPPDGQQGPISRTWLFIQLPWTVDPDIFNHLPYKDFTVDQLN